VCKVRNYHPPSGVNMPSLQCSLSLRRVCMFNHYRHISTGRRIQQYRSYTEYRHTLYTVFYLTMENSDYIKYIYISYYTKRIFLSEIRQSFIRAPRIRVLCWNLRAKRFSVYVPSISDLYLLAVLGKSMLTDVNSLFLQHLNE
jgi:hypothetical protein